MAFAVKYRCEWIDDLGVGWRYDVEEDGWYDDSNLLTNPGFEGGFTNWNTLNGPNISTVTDEKYDGNMCVRCDGAYNTINITSQDYQGVKKGQQYTASWWQKNLNITAGTTNPYMRFNIAYFNGPDYVGEAAESVNPPSNSDWQFNSFTFTTRTDLDYDRLRIHPIYMRDATGVIWVDNVKLEEGPVATPGYTELIPTDEPLRIEFLTYSDDLLRDPIKGSTATLNIECTENFQYIDLYDEADMVRRVKIYYGSTPTLYWQGWLSSEYSEPYDAPPYTVSITALDGLGLLKYIDFKDGASYYSGRETEREIILNILGKIGYTEFDEFVNLYEDRINSDTDDSPLTQIKVEQDLFQDEDCYTVLVEILKHYNAIIRQEAGKFIIYRPIELIGDTVYGRTITASTITATSLSPDQYLYRDGYNTSELRDFNGGMLMMRAPAANVKGIQNYNQVDSWIRNSNFDINRYSGGDFDSWTIVSPVAQFTKISSVIGWENEKNGVGIGYPGSGTPNTSNYIYQEFGAYAEATANVLEFSFDYRLRNGTDSPINTYIYVRIRDAAGTIWLKKKTNSESELDEATSASFIQTEVLTAAPGLGQWQTWRRYKVGMTKPGPYQIFIYCSINLNVTLGIRNVVFRATSDQIAGYTYAVTGKFLWWKFTGATRQYQIQDVEEVVRRDYTKTNSVNGEVDEVAFGLGDVSDLDIDNVMDQFNGALSIETTPTLPGVASNFATAHGSAYTPGGVIVSSDTNKVRFTSSVAGQNFTGATSISNVSGDLNGTVSTVQANVAGQNEKKRITLSGTNGSVNINIDGQIYSLDYETSLNYTAEQFIFYYETDLEADGYIISHPLGYPYIDIEKTEVSALSVSVSNVSGTLQGSVSTIQAYVAPVARIDEVTLSGATGTANITCDGVTRLASMETVKAFTESWSTRGGSEESNLLELLVDEIAALKSKGRQFIQVNIMENDPDTFLKLVSNVQDPINVSGAHNRVFVPTRGSYDVARRTWTIDMIEIGEKTAPAVGYYVYYTDGATEYRKGVRWGGFVVDKALTATGFDGVMDVDWENIRSVS